MEESGSRGSGGGDLRPDRPRVYQEIENISATFPQP